MSAAPPADHSRSLRPEEIERLRRRVERGVYDHAVVRRALARRILASGDLRA